MQYEMQLKGTETKRKDVLRIKNEQNIHSPFPPNHSKLRFLFSVLFAFVTLVIVTNGQLYAGGNKTIKVDIPSDYSVMGSVSIDGTTTLSKTVSSGTTVKIIANANDGYVFTSWRDGNGSTVSQNSTYEFQLTSDVTYYAYFAKIEAPTVTAGSNCGSGTVSLSASPGTNGTTCRWYESSSSTTVVATGTSYSPNLTSTKTYYVSSYNETQQKEGLERTQVTATINPIPSAPSVTAGSNCGPGTVSLSASPGANGTTCRWYESSSGGSVKGTGTSFTTPSLNSTKVYYVSSYNATTGCEGSRTQVTATINPIPSAPSVTPGSNCGPGTVSLSATVGTNGTTCRWYESSSGGTAVATGTSYSPTLSSTKTYYVSSYNENTGCEGSRTQVTATIKEIPSVSISGADAICSGSSTTLTASQTNISAWRWSHSSTVSSYQVSVSPNSTTTYTVTVTGTNGCTNTASKTVTVNALPDAPTASGNSRCGEGTVQLTATAPSGSTCDWYSVATGGDPVSTSTTTYTTPSISSTQNYYVVSRNTGTGCVSSSRTHVIATVNPVPAAPSVTPGSNCGPGTVSLSATVGTDGTTCKWYDSNTGGTAVATGTSYSPTLSSTKTYYVSSYNENTGCEGSRTQVTATIKTIPAVAVDPTSVTVGRTSTGTTTTTLTASGATSYSWYKDASSVGSGESFTTPNDLSEGEHTYQVVGTTDGCSNTATATVTVVMPAVTLNEINASPAVLCKNESSTLTATASSSKGTVDWSWISSSGSSYSGYQITVTPDVTTTYTVTATARAASVTATATKTVTITVNSRPAAPTLTGVTRAADTFIVCNSNSITLTANPGTGNTCKWYNAGGTMVYEGDSYTINSLSPGIYDYNVYAVNSVNCESENATHAVAVIGANPTISNVNHTDISCHDYNDGKIEVTASPIPPAHQLIYTRSDWSVYRTDGNFEDLEGGTYTIRVKDNFGCETTWSSPVTIVNPDALTLTIVSGSKDQQKCAGNAIDNITFNSNGTMTATVLPAGLSFNPSTGVLSGEPTATGDNSYTITATNANNCDSLTITGTITKYSLPNVTVTADATTLGRWPSPDTHGATQTTLRASGASTYTWYKASENLGTGSTYTTPSTLTDGTYTYKVIGTDDHSCSNTATTTVTVVTPAVTLSDITATETVLCHQGSTELTTSTQSYTGTSEVSYSWSGTGLTSTTGATVSASQLSNTTTAPITNTYTVTATATAGSGANAATATATKSIDIKVYPKVVMNPLPNDTVICNGKTIPKMSFSSTLPADSMTYTWSVETSANNVFAIRTVAPKDTLRDGVGDFPSSKIKNSNKKQTVTICVVPHYGHAPNMCSGDTLKRVITVYPAVSTTFPTINSMCSQTDMDIRLVTKIKDAGGTYSYEWKVYRNRITGEGLQSSKTPGDSVFYINARNISNAHNVTKSDSLAVIQYYTAYGDTLVCMSSWQYKKITVYPNPGMNAISPSDDQYICHDGTMNEVTLSSRISSAYMKYEWTRTNTENVGGLRDGTVTGSVGKIKDSVLTNLSNTEQTTTVSIRPILYGGSTVNCPGSDDSVKTFKIHVSPKAVMTDLSSNTQTLCHGEALSTVTFGTNIDPSGNVLYKWSRDNTNIGGIDASCENNCTGISSDAVTNTTNTAQVTTITVTPKYYSSNFSSCNWETSSDRTFTITVNPETKMTADRNRDVISHDSLLTVTFNTNITDGNRTFHWKRDNNAVSQWEMEGTDNISVHPENTTSTPQVVNVKAWLSYTSGGESCTTSSDTVSFSITVNPRVTMNITAPANPNQTICSGNQIDAVRFGTDLTIDADKTIEYNWTRTTVSGVSGLEGPGQGDISATAMSNSSGNQATTTFTVTPRYTANGITVDGEPVQFNITLKVAPAVSITQPAAICSGNTISSTETINDHGGTLTVSKWQKKHGDTWSDFSLGTPLNYENNGDKLRYVVENECGLNNSEEKNITVYQSPATPRIAVTPGSAEICAGGSVTLTASSQNTDAGGFKWTLDGSTTSTANPYIVSNLSAGTHTVTVTQVSEHGCGTSAAASQTIKVHNITITNVTANPTAVCGEGDVTLSATVNSSISGAASVVWTNNIGAVVGNESSIQVHPSTTTTYTVSASIPNVGCTVTSTQTPTVNVYPAFNPGAITSGTQTVTSGAAISQITSQSAATGGNGTYTYQWRKNGSEISNTNSVNYTPSAISDAGTYVFTRWAKDATCSGGWVQSSGSYTVMVTTTATGGYTITLDAYTVVTKIEAWGGGGGGYTDDRKGGGGGGGGYARIEPENGKAYITSIESSSTLYVYNGPGGSAGADGSSSYVRKNNSSGTLYLEAYAGKKGDGSTGGQGGQGGTSSVFSSPQLVKYIGGNGGNGRNSYGSRYGGGGGGAAGSAGVGNSGSNDSGGSAGYSNYSSAENAGNGGRGAGPNNGGNEAKPGNNYGGGGGGRGGDNNNRAGKAGAQGIAVVYLATAPSATITQPSAICENTSLSITPTISWGDGTETRTQQWQFAANSSFSSIAATTPDLSTFSVLSSFNNYYVRLAVTTEYGTRYSNAVQISVKQKQHPLFDLSTEYCPSGNDIALSNFANNSDGIHEGGIRGSWATTAEPSTAITTLPGDNTGASDSSYSIKFTHNSDYCAYDTAFTVKVWAKPSVSLSSNKDQTVCQGTSVGNITITANNANAAASWSFNKGGDNSSLTRSGQTISGTMANAGTFNYSVTVGSAHSCTHTATASGTITVTPYNTITLTSASTTDNQTICKGSNIVTITYSTTRATGADFSNLPAGVSGSWNNNVVTISGTPTEGGTFNYTVTMTGGCTLGTNTATGTITVNDPQITLQALRDTTVCSGNQVEMKATVTAHQSDNITYAWYKDGGTTAYKTVSSFTEAYNTTTSYRLVATAWKTMNGKQCSVSDEKSATITITNPAVTNLNITANPASICYEDSSTLTASCTYTGSSISYSWTGAGLGQTSGAVVKAGATGTAGSTTEYTVTATATSGSCTVTDTHTVTVTVNPKVVMSTPSPVTICHNEGVNIPFSNSGTGLMEADMRYTWTSSNANVGGLTPGTVTSTGIVASALTNTTTQPQTTTITVTPKYLHNGIECTGTPVNFTITVKPEVKMNEPVVSPNTTICHGGSISMTFSPSLTGGTTTYSWTRNNTDVVGGTDHGNGNIVNLTLTNTNSTFKQTTFKVTPIFEGCTATASGQREITVSVNPKVVMDTPSDTRICHNDNLNVNFTTSMTGGETTYSWTRNNTTSVGGTASGNGDISGLKLTNTTNQAQVTTFEVTPTYKHNDVSCTGTPITFNVTVNPQVKMKHVADQTLCHNTSSTAVTLTSPITDGTVSYSWYRDNTTNITGLVNSGTSSTLAAATALNNTATVQTTTYRVTPTYTNGISCTMTGDSTFKITVYPSVSLAQVDAQYVSHDSIKKIQLQSGNSTDGSISYTWNRTSVANVTGSENGSGNTLSDLMQIKLSNTNNEPKTVTFTVTPTYHNNGKDCQGATMSFNVTVNPKVTMKIAAPTNPNQTICSGDNIEQVTFGTELSLNTERTIVYNWTRTSESGVSGLEGPGQGNIAATAMSNSNTEPKTVTFTVTPRYTANSITIDGETKTFTITVNPEVKMNPISDKTLCNGEGLNVEFGTTLAVGTTSYTWTRNNTAEVGGTGSGNGNISGLTLTNSNTTYKTTTFTVTPTFTYGGKTCTATQTNEQQFTVTVNPTVQMATPANDTICHNEQLNVAFSTSYTGGTVTYAWSRDNDNVGGTTSGNGNISNLKLTNTTNSPQTTEFTVTPTYTNGASCTGTVVKFKVTVNPQVKMNHVADQTLCHGDNMTAVNFASALASANTRMSYAWNRDNTGNVTGLAGNGNGNIASTQLSNITTADQTSKFKVNPTYTFGKACTMTGDSTFKIVVNPKVIMVTPADVTMCNDSLLNVTFQSNLTPGTTTYSWTREGSDVSGTTSGSGNIQNLKLTNNTASAKTTTFTVTPTYTSNGKACTDENAQFVVTVYPRVQMDAIGNQHKCSGEDIAAVNFVHHITDGNVTFEWTRDNANVQGLGGLTGAVTADHIDVTTVTNTTNLPQVTTIKVTPIYRNGTTVCRGEQRSFTITVNPEVKMDAVNAQSVCDGSMLEVEFGTQLSGGTMGYSWTRTNENITGIGGLTTPVNGNISATISNSTLEAQTSTFRVIPTFTYNGVACTATQSNYRTFDVTVNKNPATPTLSSTADLVCYTTSVTYTATSTHTDAGGFRWTVDETVVSGNTSGTYNFNSPSVGNHTIKVEQVSSHGCGTSSPATKTLQVKDLQPGAITNGSMESYLCGSYTISNVTAAKCTSEDDIDYKWTCNGTDILNTNMSSLTEAQYPLNTAGTFVFKRWARTTCDACTGSTWGEATGSYTITVKHTNPGTIARSASNIYPCQDFSINNTAAAQCAAGQSPVYQWTYTKNGGAAITVDVPNTTTAITQEELPLNEPGVYVITRSAKTTCTEEEWQAATSVTITVDTVRVNPGSISTVLSTQKRVCANNDYTVSSVDDAQSLVSGQDLSYMWTCLKISNGDTTDYKPEIFNAWNGASLVVDADNPDFLLEETGLYIITRQAWAGCSQSGMKDASNQYRVQVVAPNQAIENALESNYYEVCTGGKVFLTSHNELATVTVPDYDDPSTNLSLQRFSTTFIHSYDDAYYENYENGVTELTLGLGSSNEVYLKAKYDYSGLSGCYAYSNMITVIIQQDPYFDGEPVVSSENPVCPSGEVMVTAPNIASEITGEDLPYHYTWLTLNSETWEYDTVSTEAYYSYEENGKIVHISNSLRVGDLPYAVIADNALGCSTYDSPSEVIIQIADAAPIVLTGTEERRYCPDNSGQVYFTSTIADSLGEVKWYADSLTTGALTYVPNVSLAAEGVFVYYVSQVVGSCESARIPDTIQVRYTSHIAYDGNSGALNQSLPQKSRFTPSFIDPIVFDYSNFYADGTAVPVVEGLPRGISASASNGVLSISGEPTQAGTFNYIVYMDGGECPQPRPTVTGTLTVFPTYDTTVYFSSCNNDTYTVSDRQGHSYTVNTVGTHYFGRGTDKPLKTVNNVDSAVTVVYTDHAYNQFGFEENSTLIAGWSSFNSVASPIAADCSGSVSGSQITYNTSDWNGNAVVTRGDNLDNPSALCNTGNYSLALPQRRGGEEVVIGLIHTGVYRNCTRNDGSTIVIKTSTAGFGKLSLSYGYQTEVSTTSLSIDASLRNISYEYSIDGTQWTSMAATSYLDTDEEEGKKQGYINVELPVSMDDKNNIYIRFTFGGAGVANNSTNYFLLLDNICISGKKGIHNVSLDKQRDTVCRNEYVTLYAPEPYIDCTNDPCDTAAVTYNWTKTVSGITQTLSEHGNVLFEQVTASATYKVSVGSGTCTSSDQCVVTIEVPIERMDIVRHQTECANNLSSFVFVDEVTGQPVIGAHILSPAVEDMQTPGEYDCRLSIPIDPEIACDSIIKLKLTVLKSYDTTIVASICLGDSYTDFGFNITPTETGITYYRHEGTCTTDCDSIVNLTLETRSVKQTLTSVADELLAAWPFDDGYGRIVPSCGMRSASARLTLGSSNGYSVSTVDGQEVSPLQCYYNETSKAIQLANGFCAALGSPWQSYDGTCFEMMMLPRDYDNLLLSFDYKKSIDDAYSSYTDINNAFNTMTCYYKFGKNTSYPTTGSSISLNGGGSWTSAQFDLSSVQTIDKDTVYLKFVLSGGNKGAGRTVRVGLQDRTQYYSAYFTIDNFVLIGDKPTQYFLSESDVEGETEFCEGGSATFVAQTDPNMYVSTVDTFYFKYFDFYLTNDVNETYREPFTSNKMTITPSVPANYSIVAYDRTLECDSVLGTYLIQLNNTAHIAEDESVFPDNIINAPGTCSGVPFVFVPEDGVHGVVPPATKYTWDTPSSSSTGGIRVVDDVAFHDREDTIRCLVYNEDVNMQQVEVKFSVVPWVGDCPGDTFKIAFKVNPAVSMTLNSPLESTCPGVNDITYSVSLGDIWADAFKLQWEFHTNTTVHEFEEVSYYDEYSINLPYICDTTYNVKVTYTDRANCSLSKSVTISAVDEEAPTLTGTWPADITGQNNCFANADRSVFTSDADVKALFEDNCTGDITVTHDDTDNPTDDCGWTITRTYTIKDACNNIYYTDGSSTLPFQKLSGSDQTGPTYTRPKDTVLYVSCAAVSSFDTTVTALGKPTGVSDNCSAETSITVTHRDSIVSVCGHAEKIYRIWRATDACGNVSASDSVQFINVIDTVQLTATADTTQKICITKTVQTITFGGNGTLSVSPALPAGLTFDATARTISGTPENPDTIRYVVRATNGCSDYDKTISGTIIVTPPIKLNAIIDSAECGNSNGTIMAFATGGTLPYTFKINGTGATETGIFNRLSEGSYTISVTDADNCPFTPEGGLVAVVQQLDVQDIKGVTRYGQLTDYDSTGNMIDRYGNLDVVPHLNQYGAVIPHDRTMSDLTATADTHAISVSVKVTKVANAHTLEFQYSTDGANFTLYGSKKITNLTNGTTYSHTFPNVASGTYHVRAILRTCHEETVTEMVTVEVQ